MTGAARLLSACLYLWLGFILLLAGQASGQTPTPTFGGDCCAEHAGPGCDDAECAACICDSEVNSVCCEGVWDELCVLSAEDTSKTGCAGQCPCVSPTPTATLTPTPGGDCCEPHGGPGCDVDACEACVCETGMEIVCCNEIWDEFCVGRALDDECVAQCACNPKGTPTPTPTLGPTPTPGGDCCVSHGGPSCDDSRCRECVCGEDEMCCSLTWDGFCVNIAQVECAPDCPCEPTADCCTEHETIGCDQARCQDCVCEVDDFCCSSNPDDPRGTPMWDEDCVATAAAECALDCTCDVGAECCLDHEGIGCNVFACQDCVCDRDDFCCSTDPNDPRGTPVWDDRCVAIAANPDECGAECPCGTADCCVAHGGIGCDDPQCESCVCGIDAPCCTEDGWDQQCADEAVTDCDSRCSCEMTGEGDCCSPHPEEGCELSACEECVCNIDEFGAFCCDPDGEWDRGCVDIASRPDQCASLCTCEPISNCCFGRGEEEGAGCDDSVCEDCVCDADGACCTGIVWDDFCADISKNPDECGFACSCAPPCAGDCRGDGSVDVSELVLAVGIVTGDVEPERCPRIDVDGDDDVSLNEVVVGVSTALVGCPP